MINLFSGLSKLLKYRRTHIDGTIFRLHYTLTVILLLVFCITITTKQFAGEPIICETGADVPKDLINGYCYIHSTFIIKDNLLKDENSLYPGVKLGHVQQFEYKTYYQWVSFVLLFQAACFYLPRWIWKTWEGGKINSLVSDLNYFNVKDKENKIKLVAEYLKITRNHNDTYAIRYIMCELLAFLNLILQMLLLDQFFDGEFLNYGLDVIGFLDTDPGIRVDPMTKMFPRMTKCIYKNFGRSGNIVPHDCLCLLSINIINEKIFIFVWFWFLILFILTGFMLIFRIGIILCSVVRSNIIRLMYPSFTKEVKGFEDFIEKLKIGDWLIIYLLGQNLDLLVFKEIAQSLCKNEDDVNLTAGDMPCEGLLKGDEKNDKNDKK